MLINHGISGSMHSEFPKTVRNQTNLARDINRNRGKIKTKQKTRAHQTLHMLHFNLCVICGIESLRINRKQLQRWRLPHPRKFDRARERVIQGFRSPEALASAPAQGVLLTCASNNRWPTEEKKF